MSIHVDWLSLIIVAAVSVAATVVFTVLLSAGIRSISLAGVRSAAGRPSTPARTAGVVFIGAAGLLVLFGIYLIVPFFH